MRSSHDWRNPLNAHSPDDPLAQIDVRAVDTWASLAVGILYFLCTQLSRLLDAGSFAPSIIWIADGVAIGLLIMAPRSQQWLSLSAVFFANLISALMAGAPLASTMVGALSNTAQVGLSVALLQSIGGTPVRALSQKLLLAFLFGATGLITAAAALSNATAAWLLLDRPFGLDWVLTFTSDALGILVMCPLIAAWALAFRRMRDGLEPMLAFRPLRLLEGTLAVAATLLLTYWLFMHTGPAASPLHPQVYLVLPAMLWICTRFGLRTIASTLFAVAAVAVYQTAAVYANLGSIENALSPILETQAFLIAVTVSILFTASVLNERRVAEQEMAALRNTFQSVLRASDNLVFEIDPETRTIRWIGDPERVIGWSAATISNIDQWNARVHPEDRLRLIGIRQRLLEGLEAGIDVEYRVVHPNGEYTTVGVHAYGADVIHSRTLQPHRRIIGFVKNITEQKKVAQERTELAAALRHAQKMESIGQLAGGIAHDFNNVLASILGYAEMSQEKLAKPAVDSTVKAASDATNDATAKRDATLSRYLATIQRAGERGRDLTAQILTFSRSRPERAVSVDLRPLIDEVAALLRGSHPNPIVVEMLPTRALTVRGDATSLHQLLMNLCTNGLQANDEANRYAIESGGVASSRALRIAAEEVTITSPLVTPHGVVPAGPSIRITVDDEGVGIPAEVIDRIFDPFFTTKAVGKGTGLGLSLALSICRAHGGGMTVDTRIGAGTTFQVYLPVDTGEPVNDALAIGDGRAIRGLGQEVLLVDDDRDLRELGKSLLANLGYRVTTANSGAEALRLFEASPTRFAAIVTDEVMPELTGTQLAATVHEQQPMLPIIIVTAYGGTGFALRAQQAGVFRILSKPYNADALGNALTAALSAPQ